MKITLKHCMMIIMKGAMIMKMTYRKVGNYQLPNITLPTAKKVLGKYSIMRLNYLKQNNQTLYQEMMMSGELNPHLIEVQTTAEQKLEELIPILMEQENITEEMKQKNQMKWIQKMNQIKAMAEEMILHELIYN
ncbi:MAG TPA: TnpV protein [Candidatus Caccenecus avistercoris]|nr:TnpV protein [Candidatus Caccenecus avistercoris]